MEAGGWGVEARARAPHLEGHGLGQGWRLNYRGDLYFLQLLHGSHCSSRIQAGQAGWRSATARTREGLRKGGEGGPQLLPGKAAERKHIFSSSPVFAAYNYYN